MTLSVQRDNEDAQLLARIAAGEETALTELYDRYAQLLYTLAMRIVRSIEEAEDITQDVFLYVWRKRSSPDTNHETVSGWLVAMTRNRALERLRAKGMKKHGHLLEATSLNLVSQESNPNRDVTAGGESKRRVNGALQMLTATQQHILALAYYEGFTQSEIAGKLNIPREVIPSEIQKSLRVLQSSSEGYK